MAGPAGAEFFPAGKFQNPPSRRVNPTSGNTGYEIAFWILYRYNNNFTYAYTQNGLPTGTCNDAFKAQLASRIAPRGRVTCCNKDGCNWNATTVENNLFVSTEIEDKTVAPPGNGNDKKTDYTPYIIIACVVAALLFCICCFCCIRYEFFKCYCEKTYLIIAQNLKEKVSRATRFRTYTGIGFCHLIVSLALFSKTIFKVENYYTN